MFCAKFGWNLPSGSGEQVENVKILQTDKQTDAGQKGVRKFTSGEEKNIHYQKNQILQHIVINYEYTIYIVLYLK